MNTSPYADHNTSRLIDHLKITSASARKFYTHHEFAFLLGISVNTLSYHYYRGALGIKPMPGMSSDTLYCWNVDEVNDLAARWKDR